MFYLGHDGGVLCACACTCAHVCMHACCMFSHRGEWRGWLDHTKNVGVNHISNGDLLKVFRQQCSKVRFVF